MDVEAKEFQLSMTQKELWTLAFNVHYSIESTLKTHWVNHQQSWKQNEAMNLNMHKIMFYALGRPDLHEQIFVRADEIFKAFKEKNEAK